MSVIRKQDIINAVMTEPLMLACGFWVDPFGRDSCEVCAVGAILRQAGASNTQIKDIAVRETKKAPGGARARTFWRWRARINLRAGYYLAAISCVWESHAKLHLQRRREVTCNWIRKNIPDDLALNIHGIEKKQGTPHLISMSLQNAMLPDEDVTLNPNPFYTGTPSL